ncbi:MAG: lipid II flippase MurJ, partial [Holophagaceae bacterium]
EAAVRTGIFFLGTLTLLLTFLVLGVLFFMNPITGWLTMGRDATQHDLTTLLARIMFPYLVLVSLTAGMAGLLNFKGKFILAASVSIFWNLAFILFAGGMILTLKSSGSEPMETQVALICAQAVLVGGLVQLGVLVPSAFRMGFRFRPGLHFKNPWVLKALKRMAPGLITAGIYPINVLVSTALASRLSDGAQV